MQVRVTHAEHAAGVRVGTGKTQPVGYVVAGTQTVYFAGDTDLFPGMGALGRVDVALLPVGRLGTATSRRAISIRAARWRPSS